jgi:predicted PurR-regulated permease PerM
MAAILSGVVVVLYLARDILIPLAFAIILALVLSPAVGWLQKLHFRRFPAVLLVMLVSIAVAGGISYVIFNQLLEVVNELPSYRENIDNKIRALRTPNKGALGRAAQSVEDLGKELATAQEAPPQPPLSGRTAGMNTRENPLPVQVIEGPANSLIYIRDLTRPVLVPLAILTIVLVFTVFLLVEEADLRNRLFRLAGLNRVNLMTQALDDATQRVSRYLMLQFLVNAGFGLLCGVGLHMIGVPYAALWGSVAALFRIVPYIGAVVAGLFPLLLSLAVFDGWRLPLLVFLLFSTLELITGNLLEPRLYGSHTGISSLALLLTTVFWATLWGPAGLILSTPLTVCVVVLGRHIPHLSFLHILLGDEPVLAAEAHLYQRLLAMDEQEARTVVEEYLGKNSLLELYDNVILPALTMAELDRHKGALDPEREEFLFLSLREMLAEFSERAQNAAPEQDGGRLDAPVPGRVLCFPAHDEADEIAAAMLSQLLEQAGCPAISFPLGASPQTMLGLVEPVPNDVLCISAVPPFAFSHARTVNRLLRAKFPQARILIGVWGFNGEREGAVKRFQPLPPDKLVTSLADALEYVGVPAPEENLVPTG